MHYKATDTRNYLHHTSLHPDHCKQAIPYSQFLRFRRICSDNDDFAARATEMKAFFQARGYPESFFTFFLIRERADLICSPLCVIFNQSLRLGIFPDVWKNAQVTPLFKQGEQNDLNNYRPISVISVVAKVFERIAYEQLDTYLMDND